MAYNSFYQPYQPVNYGQQFQGYNVPPINQQAFQQAQNAQQIQNSGFVSVPSETVARNYPVAPGNSVTFIDENAPYCYTKTMGFSQLDRPRFEKFRLVKEEDQPIQAQTTEDMPKIDYALKSELEALKQSFTAEIENLKTVFVEKSAKKLSKIEKEVDLNE